MKILWVGHNLAYPPKGGVLQRNYNLLREAAKRCEVHMLAFDQPATRPPGVSQQDCVRALEKFCAKVQWLSLPGGVIRGNRYWVAFRGLVSHYPYDFQWLRSREMRQRLQEVLDKVIFDVVHFDTLGLAQYRPCVRDSAVVLNHHNVESSMMVRRAINERNMVRRHYWYKQARKLRDEERKWCPRFELNLVVSREEADLLIESMPGLETSVVANGVDTGYFKPRPDPGGRTLLFCGSLDWYPNTEAMKFFFDRVWPKLTRLDRDAEIYVVGANPPNWLRRLSAADRRIHVPGFVEDVRFSFRKATAYVCPIRDGGGTRLKVLDALAMGVPLIATSFACSGLSLEKDRHVLIAEKPEEFVYKIEQVLLNPTLRMGLATAGRKLVECVYSWNVIGQSLIEAYESASRIRSEAKALLEM